MTTIFTKIIKGELPCYKIAEDDNTFAFLDINPHNLGHTLIVPKVEVENFYELDEPYYSAVFAMAKRLAPAIKKATGSLRVGMMLHGMGVPEHVHIHLIPIFAPDDMNIEKARKRPTQEMERIHKLIMESL